MSVLDAQLPALAEAKDSLAKASTPEPFSTSRTSNWVARGGGLPDYIQHIAHDLVEKRGKSESNAIQMAIGIVKNWASGKGNVDANTRAAAAKALKEWEELKTKNAAKGAASAVAHSDAGDISVSLGLQLAEDAEHRLFKLAQAIGPYKVWELLTESMLFERDIPQSKRMELAKKGQAFSDGSYPIENQGDLNNAWQAVGRGNKDKSRVVALIKRVAKKLGLKLPESLQPQTQEALAEADASTQFNPMLKRTASASSERERFEVHDNGQHVGYLSRRAGYGRGEGDRWRAHAISGDMVADDIGPQSKQQALDGLKRHLTEAPARVRPHSGGKFLVAKVSSYSGPPSFTEFPDESSARFAAGLPPKPSTPETAATMQAVSESIAADLALVESFAPDHFAELWSPLFRGCTEGDCGVPFGLTDS